MLDATTSFDLAGFATKELQGATAFLQEVPKFLQAADKIATMKNGAIILMIVGAIPVLVLCWYALRAIERKQNITFKHFDAYIAMGDSADEALVAALKDIRDARYFKMATGIHAEKIRRNAFIKAHEKLSNTIAWTHIRRALPYIDINEAGSISIRAKTKSDTVTWWFHLIFAILAGCFAVVLFGCGILLPDNGAIGLMIAGVLYLGFAMFIVAQNWPANASTMIDEELKRRACASFEQKLNGKVACNRYMCQMGRSDTEWTKSNSIINRWLHFVVRRMLPQCVAGQSKCTREGRKEGDQNVSPKGGEKGSI